MSKSMYDRRWQARRARQLAAFPLCRLCREISGRIVAATVADHVEPHRGDPVKFAGPLQSLCAHCHNSLKQQIEKGGGFRGSDLQGNPIDPGHPWNKAPGRAE